MDEEGLDWRRLPPQGAAAAQAAAAAAAAAEEAAAAARASAAERRSADAAALALDTQPRPSPLLAKVEALFREGYVIADGCIDAVQVRVNYDHNCGVGRGFLCRRCSTRRGSGTLNAVPAAAYLDVESAYATLVRVEEAPFPLPFPRWRRASTWWRRASSTACTR